MGGKSPAPVGPREAGHRSRNTTVFLRESTDKDHSGGMRSEKEGLGPVHCVTRTRNRETRPA
jgi:hypothetical protein